MINKKRTFKVTESNGNSTCVKAKSADEAREVFSRYRNILNRDLVRSIEGAQIKVKEIAVR